MIVVNSCIFHIDCCQYVCKEFSQTIFSVYFWCAFMTLVLSANTKNGKYTYKCIPIFLQRCFWPPVTWKFIFKESCWCRKVSHTANIWIVGNSTRYIITRIYTSSIKWRTIAAKSNSRFKWDGNLQQNYSMSKGYQEKPIQTTLTLKIDKVRETKENSWKTNYNWSMWPVQIIVFVK